MLEIQAEEGEGSGHPSEPQPPPSTAQPIHKEPIPNVVSSLHQKTQTPRVERATTTTASLDAAHASGGSPRCQEAMGGSIAQTRSKRVPTPPHDLPLPIVNTLGSDEGKDLEDSSKQGRMIEEIDEDAGVTLVTPTHSQEDQPKDQLGVFCAAKVLADATKNVHTYNRRRRAVSTGSSGISTDSILFSTTEESVSTASASMLVNTAGTIQEVNKDKGKGIMTESEPEQTKIKLQQRQERAGYEAVVRLQEQLDKEERQRIARVHEEASSFNIEE
ncbi:hypothetical protein Tco_0104698 [Tanacetum coccineum]